MQKQQGRQSFVLPTRPRVKSFAAIVGDKEGKGPLGRCFDSVIQDDTLGESSWEKAEIHMMHDTVTLCLEKAEVKPTEVDMYLSGDLLNQIVTASFSARQLAMPFLGMYTACATMAETLAVGAMLLDGGFGKNVVCAACSHFSTAERQYRFPLEMGSVKPPYSQWTVTGAGATLLSSDPSYPIMAESITIGKVIDLGQNDESNLGAAMAPSAADTLCTHLREMNRSVRDYDLIVTGDLGKVGHSLFKELCLQNGLDVSKNAFDCGAEIFSDEQKLYAGGSGVGCSAVVLNSHLLQQMQSGKYRRILFMATGALFSPTSNMQGHTIPGIAHAVSLEVE